eukprot:TRINITY_DN24675_c0_g1_i1.p1 TRINITY_DN24675_c0_g1~~TRINITY_DN24675_c0_g1_i1.p1  ORF type:complete len:117 (-),score=38.98 TRINITY_DN24675_c0_g1_i1:177-527(-)
MLRSLVGSEMCIRDSYNTDYDVSMEAALRIPMFDISIIQEVLSTSSEAGGAADTIVNGGNDTTSWEDCCWYHQVLHNPTNRTTVEDRIPIEMAYNVPHCARQDAFKMAMKLRDLLL